MVNRDMISRVIQYTVSFRLDFRSPRKAVIAIDSGGIRRPIEHVESAEARTTVVMEFQERAKLFRPMTYGMNCFVSTRDYPALDLSTRERFEHR